MKKCGKNNDSIKSLKILHKIYGVHFLWKKHVCHFTEKRMLLCVASLAVMGLIFSEALGKKIPYCTVRRLFHSGTISFGRCTVHAHTCSTYL
jgi:hypothetical protein